MELEEAPPLGIALAELFTGKTLYVVPDNRGIAHALVEKLAAAGISAQLAATPPADASLILFLEGCSQYTEQDAEANYIALNERFFSLAASHASALSKPGNLFVSVQDTGGAFGLQNPTENRAWSGGLAALAKTAALEWPEATIKAIDIDCRRATAEECADAIYLELLCGGLDTQIAIDTKGRRQRVSAKEETAGQACDFPLSKGDVIVVSGGARGVTATCLIELSKKVPLKIAILARTPLADELAETKECHTETEIKQALYKKSVADAIKLTPKDLKIAADRVLGGREARQNIQLLEKNGSEVLYFPIDIRQLNAVEETLKKVRTKWKKIDGVIHAAGVLADKYLKDKSLEQFRSVFETKVLGLKNLLQATQKDSLKVLCCFSSIAAFVGNVGQCDYAMANEICNQICEEEQRTRSDSCRVKSLLWGPWAGGMADTALQQHFEKMGIKAIPLQEGGEAFVKELAQKSRSVSIILGDAINRWVDALQSLQLKKNGDAKKRFIIWIHRSTYPFLYDHRIQNTPVVPMMLQLVWSCGLAEAITQGYETVGCHNLRILKGLLLHNFDTSGDLFYLEASPVQQGQDSQQWIDIAMTDVEGIKRYSCSVGVAPKDSERQPPAISPLMELKSYPFEAKEAYVDKSLFHGPAFQVLEKLEGYSEHGSLALLNKHVPPGHTRDAWLARIMQLDATAQLSLLCHWQNTGQYMLPMHFEEIIMHNRLPMSRPVKCLIKISSLTATKMKVDMHLLDINQQALTSFINANFITTHTSTLNTENILEATLSEINS